MPRARRILVPDCPVHITHRGNNRTRIFVDDADYNVYRWCLLEMAKRTECAVHHYALMSNHAHLLVTPQTADGCPRLVQGLGRLYVRYFNDRHGRTGTLWEGRYHSSVIDSERYFLRCGRYIERNPVRAGIVAHPADYAWSSYRHNALGEREPLLTEHPLYHALGVSRVERRAAYRAIVDLDSPPDDARIRRAHHSGMVLGDWAFEDTIAEELGRSVSRITHGGDRRSRRRNRARATL